MNKTQLNQVSKRILLGDEIASSKTDPDFYAALEVLPNPDQILRKLGKTQETYMAIAQDAHVQGEIRSARAGLFKYEYQLTASGDSKADQQALMLCQEILNLSPNLNMRWDDILWQMAQAQYFGFSVHEVVWQRQGEYILPKAIIDRANHRFSFSTDGKLLIKTKGYPKPQAVPDYRFLITRHQPASQNPYGIALFSSCFWPYTFKHAGFRSYTKFINKYGLPWAIGKYPEGTNEKDRDALVQALAQMVEDAVGAIPDGNSVDLIETKSTQAPQHDFISLCNKEMSKALTSQTMATEQEKNGSRAAGEVAREREQSIDTATRSMVASSMNQLMNWITTINVQGATPPKFSFYEQDQPNLAWVEALETANKFMPVSKQFAQAKTGIQLAQNQRDELKTDESEFARQPHAFHDAQQEQMNAIYQQLSKAGSLQAFRASLNQFSDTKNTEQALTLSMLDSMIKGQTDE